MGEKKADEGIVIPFHGNNNNVWSCCDSFKIS